MIYFLIVHFIGLDKPENYVISADALSYIVVIHTNFEKKKRELFTYIKMYFKKQIKILFVFIV